MEFLRNYTMTIISTAIFGLLCDFLLPNTNIKKYVKFLIGVMLITSISNFFIKNLPTSLELKNMCENSTEQNLNINLKKTNENFKQLYITKLKQDIKDTIEKELNYRIENLEIILASDELPSEIKEISIVINGKENKDVLKGKICDILEKKLEISKFDIKCEVRQ